jgi:hypothetical protein
MRFTLTAAIFLLMLASSACDSFKQGFSENFDAGFKESCRNGLVKKGVSQTDADKYCSCTLVKFKETKSMDDAVKACVAELKSGTNH